MISDLQPQFRPYKVSSPMKFRAAAMGTSSPGLSYAATRRVLLAMVSAMIEKNSLVRYAFAQYESTYSIGRLQVNM